MVGEEVYDGEKEEKQCLIHINALKQCHDSESAVIQCMFNVMLRERERETERERERKRERERDREREGGEREMSCALRERK